MTGRGCSTVTCDCGAARSGPAGAWWVGGTSRGGGRSGFSPELPSGRMVGCNVALVAAEVAAALVAHLAGVPWWQIGLEFAGLAVLVVVSVALQVFVLGPRQERRHVAFLEACRAASEARLREAGWSTPAALTAASRELGAAAEQLEQVAATVQAGAVS